MAGREDWTVDRYGRWERQAEKAEAEKAEAEKLEGAFPAGARIGARTGLSPQGAPEVVSGSLFDA